MIPRNRSTSIGVLPRVNKPRTLFDIPVKDVKTSVRHGVLTPFYMNIVYPFDTYKVKHNLFVRSDISSKVPLDDIYVDTYYFYVPFRVIDRENFAKVLGARDDPLDTGTYSVPQITLRGVDPNTQTNVSGFTSSYLDQLIYRLQYSQAGSLQKEDTISAYSVATYYEVWNSFFRDENLDSIIPYRDLYGTNQFALMTDLASSSRNWSRFNPVDSNYRPMLNNYKALGLYQVNKKIDIFTSGMISPQKGEAVTIPLGTTAPVVGSLSMHDMGSILYNNSSTGDNSEVGIQQVRNTDNLVTGVFGIDSNNTSIYSNLVADLSQATAASINQLRISFAIQELYELRGRVGTRYIETLSQWGANVPDDMVDRPVYLGGDSMPLSNIPVLSQESATLGEMSGISATQSFGEANAWSKSFLEYGFVIGLCCFRIKHSYVQGRDNKIHDYVNDLDFYHWVYANIGFQGQKKSMIYNDPADGHNNESFNFQEAFGYLRTDLDVCAGVFSHMSGSSFTDFRTKWSYADYYESRPSFNSNWLKESDTNVARTLTGRLIPGAASSGGQQYLCDFKVKAQIARVMPAFSEPASLVARW